METPKPQVLKSFSLVLVMGMSKASRLASTTEKANGLIKELAIRMKFLQSKPSLIATKVLTHSCGILL